MAIEMIENNDFGNFTAGRQGLRSFPDEDCKNYFGDENFFGKDIEPYYNLFGSRTRKDSIENVKREQNQKWSNTPQKSCSDIKTAIGLVEIDIEKLTKMSASQKDFWIAPALEIAREWDGRFKAMQLKLNCLETESKERAEREKTDTLNLLQSISDTGVQKSKEDILGLGQQPDSGDKIYGVDKKTIMYAGAGLGAILIFALILRK